MSIKKLILMISCMFLNIQALENYETLWGIHMPSYTNENESQANNLAFSMLSCAENSDALTHYLEYIKFKIVDPTIWQDFNFFYGNQKHPQKHILNQINRTKTKVGYATLAKQMTDVTNNIPELQRRQNITKALLNDANFGQIQEVLNSFSKIESDYQFIFDKQKTTELFLKIKEHYFSINMLKKHNTNSDVLEAKRLVPLLYNVLNIYMNGYLVKSSIKTSYEAFVKYSKAVLEFGANIRNDENLNNLSESELFKVYMKEACKQLINSDTDIGKNILICFNMCISSLASSKDLAKGLYSIYSSYIKNNDLKVLNEYNATINKAFNLCKQLDAIITANPDLQTNLKYIKNIKQVLNNPSENFKKLIKVSSSQSYLTYGTALAGFKLALSCKSELALLTQAIGEIDMYCGIANLLIESQNNKNKFCFVHFVDSKLPYVRLNDGWNILLDPQTTIANSISLGMASNDNGHNAILNGTNESGKSTFQKSVLMSLLFAQAIGIAPANSMELRPFDRIKYYQNISDDILDNKSLFRKQAQEFNKLFTIDPNLVTYLSIDEPATGANARNCAALSFAAAKQLQKAPWYVATISTHYPLLMSLEKVTNKYFKNYRLTNPESSEPYRLVEGISDQHREFDILRKEGLNKEILDDAINMIKNDEDLKLIPIRAKL